MSLLSALPQNVVLQTGNGQNFLTWDIVAGATSYSVQRSTDGVNYTTVGTPSVNNYLDTTVVVGTSYFYQVASVSTAGISGYSVSSPTNITPCLPGQINLGYLRYLSQLRADKYKSLFLTPDEWNSNINQSIYWLYEILGTKFGDDYLFAPPLMLALTGQISYPIPDGSNYPDPITNLPAPALLRLNGVDVNISGGAPGPNAGWVPLSRSNWSDRDRYTTFPGQAGALNNVNQLAYRVMGNQIYFFPQNMNQTVRLWYMPIMTQLLQDTDMLPFSLSGWSEFIIVDAAIKALFKEESFEAVQILSGFRDKLLERIETAAANRDTGQPNTVSNVRAVMGDPGFSNWGMGYGGGGFAGGGYGGV